MGLKHTRRKFLKTVGAGAGWIALAGALGCEPEQQQQQGREQGRGGAAPRAGRAVSAFRSRPDLSPPAIGVTTRARDTAPGYVFIASKKGDGQDGPMIIDNSGQLVWFSKDRYATDFKVQTYQGSPVLTWWEGKVVPKYKGGFSVGDFVIFDSSYQEIRRVKAGNGYEGNLHEFLITSRDTALLTVTDLVHRDLSSIGGSKDTVVIDGIVQEVDIETGEVLFEWHSLDNISFDECTFKPSKGSNKSFDYFHINSIDVDHDGNLLVSARHTYAVYKIDRKSGEVIWRLGGKKSDFEMGPGTRISRQHDARRQPDGTITIFDNRKANKGEQSRGIVVELDEDAMKATLVREYTHPDKLLSTSQANMQVLPNGNVFVGWGSEPVFSEFSRDGKLLFDATVAGKSHSYRAFRFPWEGRPQGDPAVAAEPGREDEVTLYASWNGATEVAAWEALAGPSRDRLRPVGSAPRGGFETAVTVRTAEPLVAVRAKDSSGRVLGASKPVNPKT